MSDCQIDVEEQEVQYMLLKYRVTSKLYLSECIQLLSTTELMSFEYVEMCFRAKMFLIFRPFIFLFCVTDIKRPQLCALLHFGGYSELNVYFLPFMQVGTVAYS